MKRAVCFSLFLSALALAPFCRAFGADDANSLEQRVKTLEESSKKQQEKIEEQQKTIEEQKSAIEALKGGQPEAVETRPKPSGLSGLFGGSALSNPNISLVVDTFFYSTNIKGSDLPRGIPGYTTSGPGNKKGFNLESAELFIYAPVDPYFNIYTTIPVTEDGATVEEAYFLTTSLPAGFQIKGGKFKSGIGRINSQHRHAWDFEDAPLIYRAFVGEEGLEEVGLQMTYLPELPFYLQLGAEALQGDNPVLFGSQSGPHAFAAFAKASFDAGDYSTVYFGPSFVTGRARTTAIAANTGFTGYANLYIFEFVYKCKPSKTRGFVLQSEYMLRENSGTLTNTAISTADPLKRFQDGMYIQGVYQFGRWRAGVRYDVLDMIYNRYKLDGTYRNLGPRPWRASADLEINPTEFSRIRLQYNYDRAGRDNKTNNEVIVQLTFGIGAHAAHPF